MTDNTNNRPTGKHTLVEEGTELKGSLTSSCPVLVRGRIDGEVTAADDTTLHYAMDTPDDLVLICAGSAIGALSMVMPGFGSSKTAGRSPAIQIAAPGHTSPIQTRC